MYINRIIFRNVRNFDSLDITFRNDWTNQPLQSVLLTGPNGSGKTTLLRVVAALWDNLSSWLYLVRALNQEQQSQGGLLIDSGLAAVEIHDLLEVPLWLFTASSQRHWDELRDLAANSGAGFIGEIRGSRGRPQFVPASENPWFNQLKADKERLELGAEKAKSLPNLLFLEAENRLILSPHRRSSREIGGEALYRWHVIYEPRERWEGHIETMLRNLKIRDLQRFNTVIKTINRFLSDDKQITDFDDNLRLKVQIGKQRHTIDDLSAGERQCLILIFMVSRWLMPGGITLIDEPDLHLHVSLQRQLIHELERIVAEKKGQLIVSSHSPTMWEEYNERQRIELGQREHA